MSLAVFIAFSVIFIRKFAIFADYFDTIAE